MLNPIFCGSDCGNQDPPHQLVPWTPLEKLATRQDADLTFAKVLAKGRLTMINRLLDITRKKHTVIWFICIFILTLQYVYTRMFVRMYTNI